MSGINFLVDNYVDNSNLSITSGTENAQFPLDNLKNDFTTKKFRSVGNTVVVLVDFLQFLPVNSFALVGDATSNLGVSAVSIKFSLTTDFTLSTQHDITLNSEFNIGWKFITEESARYAEITLTGTGSFSEVGKIYIGQRLNLPNQNISIDTFTYRHIDRSTVRRNLFGQKFIDVRNFLKRISGTIKFCTKEEQEQLDTMYLQRGRNKPVWLILDELGNSMVDGEYRLSMYCYLTEAFQWTANGGTTYSTGIQMEQTV
jgi:hypothetical protein